MKKICAVLLSLILVFSLCSCGASNSGGPSSPTDKPKDSSELGPGCYDDEEQILITRHGEPVVRMTLCTVPPTPRRIGVAKGKIVCPDDLDKYNDEIADMFEGA